MPPLTPSIRPGAYYPGRGPCQHSATILSAGEAIAPVHSTPFRTGGLVIRGLGYIDGWVGCHALPPLTRAPPCTDAGKGYSVAMKVRGLASLSSPHLSAPRTRCLPTQRVCHLWTYLRRVSAQLRVSDDSKRRKEREKKTRLKTSDASQGCCNSGAIIPVPA